MIKFVVGFILGFVVATAGVGGIVGMADRGVNTAKETIKEQAAAPTEPSPGLKAKWDAELKEASDLIKRK